MTEEEYRNYHNFYSVIRESGVTNMWGAAPYLQKHMGVDKKTAKEALLRWMEEFDIENPTI